ncbi:hypothetical protein Pdw03_5006 [Penicillium digitatum]|uniref:Uncharacterized protein n=3 Tax=Penicillium digitatum TaxID=36651 RepID=K9FW14_PEND2|nr:hypothetical protein PDIP_05430 [Penicillium digitatum Pd1]EKV13820.1 hypothetical protein PDIG_36050 [Penicillium digitatum PHI26]EKV21527.1 hypothetical protein PDIP_05430 [Penicillium digitatum Pd1]KAG0158364.1 hypothetical protein PDIDSM_5878 [Penicillium digitatum]QQK42152.1 hypothetical protein Pdw03_5006 [Penicillium digitatum]
MLNADTPNPIRAQNNPASVALAGQDVVITKTHKNLAPEASGWLDPAAIVTGLYHGTVSWPSASELTTYPTPSETSAVSGISSEAIPTGTLDTASSYQSRSSKSTFWTTTTTSSLSSSSLTSTPTTSKISANGDSTAFSGGPSKTTKIAIAVPVSTISLALVLALLFFLFHRRCREKERNALPPPYDMATGRRSVVPAHELMISPKTLTQEPRCSLSTPAMASTATSMPLPMPRIPIISISPSTENRGRTPTPDPSPSSGSVHRMPLAHGSSDSETELGVAVVLSMDQRRSATEQDLRGRVASVTSSRGPSRLSRMPFVDFSDDDDDCAVSVVSDFDGRRRERDFDEVSPIGEQERRF